MKTQKTVNIPFVVSFDNWDDESKTSTKEELKEMAIDFLKVYCPMSKMTLGNNSGDLVLTIKTK